MEHSRKPIRIVGCARSGTLYTTKILNQCGLKVAHEYTDTDGTVSAFGLGAPPYPVFNWVNKENPLPHEGRTAHVGEDLTKIDWLVTLHQVRHPFKCIASNTIVLGPDTYEYINRICPEFPTKRGNKLLRCMIYWYYWNLECEKVSRFTYKIEDIETRWDEISNAIEINCPFPKDSVSDKTNRGLRNRPWVNKEYDIVDPNELYSVDYLLADNIINLARKYGYEL